MSVPNQTLPPRLLSTESAAQYLGLSPRFVRQLVYRGELTPTLRLRKLLRFDVRVLDAWIAAKNADAGVL